MAGVITLLDQPRTLDALGRATDALIYFYLTGTTVLAPIYNDSALTDPAANPIDLAAGEIFPDIFLDPEVTYRRRILYGDGTIHDVDPLPDISVSADTVLYKPAGDGSVERTVSSKLDENPSSKDFGAVGDGVADDTIPLQRLFARMAVTGVATILAGTYKVTQPLVIPVGELRGGVVVLDFKTANPSNFPGETPCVKVEGAPRTQIANLNADLVIGSRTFSFATAHGLVVGDTFQLSGTVAGAGNGYRAYYTKGEMFRVAKVNSTTSIEVENAARDTYAFAGEQVWKRAGDQFNQSAAHLTVFAPDTISYAIRFISLDRSRIDNIRAEGGTLSAMDLQDCFQVVGYNVDTRQVVTAPDGYGVSISNCQDVRMNGNFHGRFNGFTTGGGLTTGGLVGMNRDIHAEGTFGSDFATGQSGANFHGNTEYSSYRGTFSTGIVLAGDKNEAHGFFIAPESKSAITFGEMHGHTFHVSGVARTFGPDLPTSLGAIEQQGYGQFARYGGRTILDLECYFPNATRLMLWRPQALARTDVVLEFRRFDLMTSHPTTRVIAVSKLSGGDLPVIEFGKFNIMDNAVQITWSFDAGTKWRGWRYTKTVAVSGTGVASATAVVTFSPNFPKTPVFHATLQSAAFAGVSPVAASISGVSATGGTVTVVTTDKLTANISSTVAVTGTLDEQ